MRYDPNKHHRRSIRLKGYDYTIAGAYYITIVTRDREKLFGEIVDGAMRLNIANIWQRNYYEHIVRGEDELNKIHEYITLNPLNWDADQNNPAKIKPISTPRNVK